MSLTRPGFAKLGLVAVGCVISGCSGTDVSAGSEGDAINLNRCYSADCGVHPQSLSGSESEPSPCGDVVGPLEDLLVFDVIEEGAQTLAAQQASDGSVWALMSVRGQAELYARIYLARFSSSGALLATSDAIGAEADHTLLDAALAIDAAGEATVGLYTNYVPTADSDLREELTLYGFDRALTPVGAPRTFRGMAAPRLAGGAEGSVWLAGNAFGNEPHGAIARVTQREPDWIQTAVPTSGQGEGGLSGLTVADDGRAAVVARLNPKWSGQGPNVVKLGLATFDATGKPLWTLELPGDYAQGYNGALGGTAGGNLVIAGLVGDSGEPDMPSGMPSSMLLRSVSRDGELGWAYSLPEAWSPDVEVRRDSGRTFASTRQGLAVIDAAGDSCRQFSFPPGAWGGNGSPAASEESSAAAADSAAWDAHAEYVFTVGAPLARVRVPE